MAELFEKARIAGMTLKNRIVKSATSENMADEEGLPTEETLRFYERLARGGSGLIITGIAYVNKDGQVFPRQSGAHDDAVIPEWKKITDAVHKHGAKIAMQIMHSGRQVDPKMFGGRRAVSPSTSFNLAYISWAREMSPEEVEQTVSDFAAAASRAKAAGFDAVQIHAAHGYLISQFLAPVTNRRSDQWGGSPDKRFKFLEEIFKGVREAVGPDFPVLCKLNIKDFTIGGLKKKHSFEYAKRLAGMGLDAIEMSAGTTAESPLDMCRGGAPIEILRKDYSAPMVLGMKMYFAMQRYRTKFKENYFLPYVEELKPQIDIPVILLGGIRKLSFAKMAIAEGKAEFISMARPLIREPDLPNKWMEGKQEEAKCVSCNRCLIELSVLSKLKCYCRK